MDPSYAALLSSCWAGQLLRLVLGVLGGLDRKTPESQTTEQYVRTTTSLVINELVVFDEWETRGCGGIARSCHRGRLR